MKKEFIVCPVCSKTDGTTTNYTKCDDCSSDVYDRNGDYVPCRYNSSGDKLALLCKTCCVSEHGTRNVKLDLKSRLEVVETSRKRVAGQLRGIAHRKHVVRHIARIREQANELLEKANRKEKRLHRNIRNIAKLLKRHERCLIEIAVLNIAIRRNDKPTKGDIRRMIEAFIKDQNSNR